MPKLIMTREQFFEIQYLTKICQYEISGMGSLLINSDGDFEIEKLFLLNQEVSSAATDIDANAVNSCMYEARSCKGTLSFWWHSHVNMNAFFSGTDVATIKDHAKHGMFVGLVINKKGDYQLAMGLQSPKLYVDKGLELVIKENISPDLQARLDSEYNAKVKTKSYNDGGYYGRNPHYLGTDAGFGHNTSDLEPLIWDEQKHRYVDNPKYVSMIRKKRKDRKLNESLANNNQKIIEKSKDLAEKTIDRISPRECSGEEISAWQKLSCQEQNAIFKDFMFFYGYNPDTEEQLAAFYADNKQLLKGI